MDMHIAMQMVLVAVGGAMGALSRFGVATFTMKHLGQGFPWGTLAVNVFGCLVMGRFMSSSAFAVEGWRLALGVGFLGSFTTFSAFGAETLHLLRHGKSGLAMLYVVASLAIGLFAVWIGWRMGTPPAGT
jgi:CrcB protein